MSSTVADQLSSVHPKMLRASSEADRKKPAELRAVIGHLVERSFELMGITKQEAAFRMGYADQGPVSRWCSATERPLFDKLFSLEGFDVAFVLSVAERSSQRIEVATVITIRRRA